MCGLENATVSKPSDYQCFLKVLCNCKITKPFLSIAKSFKFDQTFD